MEPRRSKMDPDRNHRRRRPRRRRAERQPRRAERGAGLQHETTLTNETAPPPPVIRVEGLQGATIVTTRPSELKTRLDEKTERLTVSHKMKRK